MKTKLTIALVALATIGSAIAFSVKCTACDGTGWKNGQKCFRCGGDGDVGN